MPIRALVVGLVQHVGVVVGGEQGEARKPARVEHERHGLDADVGDQAMRAALGIHAVEHRAAAVHGPVAHVEMAVTDGWHAFDYAESPVDSGLSDLVAADVLLFAAAEFGRADLSGPHRLLPRSYHATLAAPPAPFPFPLPFSPL